jgi:dipeptidyl aminopeptidase/acylaminoacyl peptidase
MLVTHGTADEEDLPERTEAFVADATAAGIPVELHWCEGAGHGMVDDVCPDELAAWVRDFFNSAADG